MPNWTENMLSIERVPTEHKGAVSKALLHPITGRFSFEAIAPMPEIIRNTGAGLRMFRGEKYSTWYENQETGETRPFTSEERSRLEEIGHTDWHSWATENWGVKWDARNAEIDSYTELRGQVSTLAFEVKFDTPWGFPDAWLDKLRSHLGQLDQTIEAYLSYRLEDDPYYPHTL